MALDGTERTLLAAAVVLFALLLFVRLRRRGETSELHRAIRLYDTDPAKGEQDLDSFFIQQAANERAARDTLWSSAQTDLKAAKELRRRLLEDIATDQLARKEYGKDRDAPPVLMQQIDDSLRDAQAQVAKLDGLI